MNRTLHLLLNGRMCNPLLERVLCVRLTTKRERFGCNTSSYGNFNESRSKDPSVGTRRNLSVGFDRRLLLISSFKKLVLEANFRSRSNPPIDSVGFLDLGECCMLLSEHTYYHYTRKGTLCPPYNQRGAFGI